MRIYDLPARTFPEDTTHRFVLEFSTLDILDADLTESDFKISDSCRNSDLVSTKLMWLRLLASAVERGYHKRLDRLCQQNMTQAHEVWNGERCLRCGELYDSETHKCLCDPKRVTD